jgi:hypothetical protein
MPQLVKHGPPPTTQIVIGRSQSRSFFLLLFKVKVGFITVMGAKSCFWHWEAVVICVESIFREIRAEKCLKTIYFSASKCLRGLNGALIPHSTPHFLRLWQFAVRNSSMRNFESSIPVWRVPVPAMLDLRLVKSLIQRGIHNKTNQREVQTNSEIAFILQITKIVRSKNLSGDVTNRKSSGAGIEIPYLPHEDWLFKVSHGGNQHYKLSP